MADLYGTAPSASPEPEEISTFLHQLLQNPSSSSSSTTKFIHHALSAPAPPHAAEAAEFLDGHRFGRSELESRCAGGNSGANFSDPGGYFAKEVGENVVSSSAVVPSKRRGASLENDAGDFSCDSEKGPEVSEVPVDTVRPRGSSKRSRTAEVHNLSEKRRRSRINEKMKALQNLIPNSNKTDKASMLDEAIEYLKQLQLQVQMLTMRNGFSLHQMCLPGVLQTMQLPLTGMSFDEGNGLPNTNTVTDTFSANEESSVQTVLNIANQCTISNQPVIIPSGANMASSQTSFGFEPLIQAHYGPFNLFTSSKEICREGTAQAQVDTSTLKASSSGVS